MIISFFIIFWIFSSITKIYSKVWIVKVMNFQSEFDNICIITNNSVLAAWWSSHLINVFKQIYDTVNCSNSHEILSCNITYFHNDLDLIINWFHHFTTLFEHHCAFMTHDLNLLLLWYRYTQSLSKVIIQW